MKTVHKWTFGQKVAFWATVSVLYIIPGLWIVTLCLGFWGHR